MNNSQTKETSIRESLQLGRVVRQLALEWVQSGLPSDEVTFVDCMNVLGNLQAATGRIDQTEAIFESVFQQAIDLRKSSDWLAVELKFEMLAQTVSSRSELAMLYLTHTGSVDDDALDLYNQRNQRFTKK